MDLRRIHSIVREDLRISTIVTLAYYLIAFIIFLIAMYTSSKLQLLSFVLYTSHGNSSYYHLLAEPILKYLLPLAIAFMIYDNISRDLRTGRIRLILNKCVRSEYLIGKFLSSSIISFIMILVLMIFVNLYAYFTIGVIYIGITGNFLLSSYIGSLFYISIIILLSVLFRKTLQNFTVFYAISFIIALIPAISKYSFFAHIVASKLQVAAVVLVLSATALCMLVSISIFERKNL